MDPAHFASLHRRFAASLRRYMDEANKLCELLEKCEEEPVDLKLRSEIAVQRSAENEAHAEYSADRERLLKAARWGYRDSDQNA